MDLDYFRLSMCMREMITLGITCLLVVFSAAMLQLSRLRVNTLFFSIILSTCEFHFLFIAFHYLVMNHNTEKSCQAICC